MSFRRLFSTSMTLLPLGKSSVRFQIDMRTIPTYLGHSTSRGMRLSNEDRLCIGILDIPHQENDMGILNEPKESSICPPVDNLVFGFAVFDGHGGTECSDFVKDQLFNNIETSGLKQDTVSLLREFWVNNLGGYWKRWSRRINRIMSIDCLNKFKIPDGVKTDFYKLINDGIQNGELTQWEVFKLKVWLAHLKTDEEFLEWENKVNNESIKNKVRSGSTSTSAFIYPLEWPEKSINRHYYEDEVVSRILISHIGDTHAILCDKDGIARPLTKDHHPSNPIEARRLRKYSRGLIMTDSFGEERYLNFANTRSFGDVSGKDKGVSAEPEFTDLVIGSSSALGEYWETHGETLEKHNVKNFGGDEGFIVLVSDGVTNYLNDQEIVDLVTSTHTNLGIFKGTPQRASEEIVGFVECINGDDNATCVVIRLNGWGKWPTIDRTGSLREGKMGSNKLF